MDIESRFAQSGQNFGNICIGSAVQKFLGENHLLARDALASPAQADEECDHVVIPAANFLWKDFDFGYMETFLARTHLPITMIGVGAQTADRMSTSQIHPNTLRLMKLVSERSASIGVRGFYTAEVLAAHGIHNVQVIGCPSIYSSRAPSLKIGKFEPSEPPKLSVNFSRRVNKHSFNPQGMVALENELMAWALRADAEFVAQDELEELKLAAGEEVSTTEMCKYFRNIPAEELVAFLKNKTRHFCDVESWATYIRSKDLSVGTRFHGNLMALINGVPAFMFVHDSRTLEMCALLGLPYLHVNDVDAKTVSCEQIQEMVANASFEQFERTYSTLFKRFGQFMSSNGLAHNLPTPGA